MNNHRPDKWFETVLRKSAEILTFLVWCTLGLLIWVFIATRVSVAFSYALFYSAFKHTDIRAAESRLSEGLHWWSDGLQRIKSSLTAKDFEYPQVSSFVFWQECLYVIAMFLLGVTYHFIVPTSQAIYSAVRERLVVATPQIVRDTTTFTTPEEVHHSPPNKETTPASDVPAPAPSQVIPEQAPKPLVSSPKLVESETDASIPSPSQSSSSTDTGRNITSTLPPETILPETNTTEPPNVLKSDKEPKREVGEFFHRLFGSAHSGEESARPTPSLWKGAPLVASARDFLEEGAGGTIWDYAPQFLSEREFRPVLVRSGIYSATLTSIRETREQTMSIRKVLAEMGVIVTIEEWADNRPPYLATHSTVLYYADEARPKAEELAEAISRAAGATFTASRGATPPYGPHLRFAIHCVNESKSE